MRKVIAHKSVAIEVIENDETTECSDENKGQDGSGVEIIKFSEQLLQFLAQNPVCGRSDYTDLPGAKQNVQPPWRLFQNYPRRERHSRSSDGQSTSSLSGEISAERQQKFDKARFQRQQRKEKMRQKKEDIFARRQAAARERKRLALLERTSLAKLENQDDSCNDEESTVVIISSPQKKPVNRHCSLRRVSAKKSLSFSKERENLFSVIHAMSGDDNETSTLATSSASSNVISKLEALISEIASVDFVPPVELTFDREDDWVLKELSLLDDSGHSAKESRPRNKKEGKQSPDDPESSVSSTSVPDCPHLPILTTLVKTCKAPTSMSADLVKETWSVVLSSSVKALADSSTERRMRRRKKRVNYIEWEEYDDLVDRNPLSHAKSSLTADEAITANIGESVTKSIIDGHERPKGTDEKKLVNGNFLNEGVSDVACPKGEEVSSSMSEDKLPRKETGLKDGVSHRDKKGATSGRGKQNIKRKTNSIATPSDRNVSRENLPLNIGSFSKGMHIGGVAHPPPTFSVDLSMPSLVAGRVPASRNMSSLKTGQQPWTTNSVSQPAPFFMSPHHHPLSYVTQQNVPANFLLPTPQGFVGDQRQTLPPPSQTNVFQTYNPTSVATYIDGSQNWTLPSHTVLSLPTPPPLVPAVAVAVSGSSNFQNAILSSPHQLPRPLNLTFDPRGMPSQTASMQLMPQTVPNPESFQMGTMSQIHQREHNAVTTPTPLGELNRSLTQRIPTTAGVTATGRPPPPHVVMIPTTASATATGRPPPPHVVTIPTAASATATRKPPPPPHVVQLPMSNYANTKSDDQNLGHMRGQTQSGNSVPSASQNRNQSSIAVSSNHCGSPTLPAKRKAEREISGHGRINELSGTSKKLGEPSAPSCSSGQPLQKIPKVSKSSREKSLKEIDDMLNNIGGFPVKKSVEKKCPEPKPIHCVSTTTAVTTPSHNPHQNFLSQNCASGELRAAAPPAQPPLSVQRTPPAQVVPAAFVTHAVNAAPRGSPLNALYNSLSNVPPPPLPHFSYPQLAPAHHAMPSQPYQQTHLQQQQSLSPQSSLAAQNLRVPPLDPPFLCPKSQRGHLHPSASNYYRQKQPAVRKYSRNSSNQNLNSNGSRPSKTIIKQNSPLQSTPKTAVTVSYASGVVDATLSTSSRTSSSEPNESYVSRHISEQRQKMHVQRGHGRTEMQFQQVNQGGENQTSKKFSRNSQSQPPLGSSEDTRAYSQFNLQPRVQGTDSYRSSPPLAVRRATPPVYQQQFPSPSQPVHLPVVIRGPSHATAATTTTTAVIKTTPPHNVVTYSAGNTAPSYQKEKTRDVNDGTESRISSTLNTQAKVVPRVGGTVMVTSAMIVDGKPRLSTVKTERPLPSSPQSPLTCKPSPVVAVDRIIERKPQLSQISANSSRSTPYSSPTPNSSVPVTPATDCVMQISGHATSSPSVLTQSVSGVSQPSVGTITKVFTTDSSPRYSQESSFDATGREPVSTVLTASSFSSSSSSSFSSSSSMSTAVSFSSLASRSLTATTKDRKPSVSDLAAALAWVDIDQEESDEEDWHEDDSSFSAESADEMMDIKPNIDHSKFLKASKNVQSNLFDERSAESPVITTTVTLTGERFEKLLKAGADAINMTTATTVTSSSVHTFIANLPARSVAMSKIASTLLRIKSEKFSTLTSSSSQSVSPCASPSQPQVLLPPSLSNFSVAASKVTSDLPTSRYLDTLAVSANTMSPPLDTQARSAGVSSEVTDNQTVVVSSGSSTLCTKANAETTPPLTTNSNAGANMNKMVRPEVRAQLASVIPSLAVSSSPQTSQDILQKTLSVSAQVHSSSLCLPKLNSVQSPLVTLHLSTSVSHSDMHSPVHLNFDTFVSPAYSTCIVAPQTTAHLASLVKEPIQGNGAEGSERGQPSKLTSESIHPIAPTDVMSQSINKLCISATMFSNITHAISAQSSSHVSPGTSNAAKSRPETTVTFVASKPLIAHSEVSPSNAKFKTPEVPLVISSSKIATVADNTSGGELSPPSARLSVSASGLPKSSSTMTNKFTISSQKMAKVVAIGRPDPGKEVTQSRVASSVISTTFPLSSSSVLSGDESLQSIAYSWPLSSCASETSFSTEFSSKIVSNVMSTVLSTSQIGESASVQVLPAVIIAAESILPPRPLSSLSSLIASSSSSASIPPSSTVSCGPSVLNVDPQITLGQSDLIYDLIRVKTELSEGVSESENEQFNSGILLSGREFPSNSSICIETSEDISAHPDELYTGDISVSIDSSFIEEDTEKSETVLTVKLSTNDPEAKAKALSDANSSLLDLEAAISLSSSSTPLDSDVRFQAEEQRSMDERQFAIQNSISQSHKPLSTAVIVNPPTFTLTKSSSSKSIQDIVRPCAPDPPSAMEDDLNAWQVRSFRSDENDIDPNELFPASAASTSNAVNVSASESSGQFTVVISNQNPSISLDSKNDFNSVMKQEMKEEGQTVNASLIESPNTASASSGQFSVVISDQNPDILADSKYDIKSAMKQEVVEGQTANTGFSTPVTVSASNSTGQFTVVISSQNPNIPSDSKDVLNSEMKQEIKEVKTVSTDFAEHSSSKIVADSALKKEQNVNTVIPPQTAVISSSNENSLPGQLETEVRSSDLVLETAQAESQIAYQPAVDGIEESVVQEGDGQSSAQPFEKILPQNSSEKILPQMSSEKEQLSQEIEIKSDHDDDDDFCFIPDPTMVGASAMPKDAFSNANDDPILIASDDESDEIIIYDDSPTTVAPRTTDATDVTSAPAPAPLCDGEDRQGQECASSCHETAVTQAGQSSASWEDTASIISSSSSCSEGSNKITNHSINALGSWSKEQVSTWLKKNKLDKICLNLSNLDGPGLQRMAFECHRDHEVFYTRVKRSLGLTMFNTLVIIRSLKSLIEVDENDIS